jgi:protein-L-isoaspartate O-methyltransferase
LRLVGSSFLMLFVELALIRWTAANNVYLAFLTNFVLLASFLGIGIGFLRARRGPHLLGIAPIALTALVAFVLAFPVSFARLSGPHQLSAAFGLRPLPEWFSLAVIFALTVVVMGGIAHTVARTFSLFPPLEAYRLDIVGSLAGIAAFAALSFAQVRPIGWGVIAVVMLAALLGRSIRWWHVLALAAMLALLAIESSQPHQYWSPYYKIIATPRSRDDSLQVSVNNIPHQAAYPIRILRRLEPFYFFPYRHVDGRRLRDVLLIGAGTGNDVAVALHEGARHIDAVEIDPELQRLGWLYHRSRPYESRRVTVHINDGRAFLNQTHRHYDLILFALPDSLTLLSGQSNLRLENYLLTIESMRSARAHLKPAGTFAMYNYYQPFLLRRYATTLQTVYRTAPCLELGNRLAGRRQAVLTVSRSEDTSHCRSYWHGRVVAPATDDWPFPYLPTRSIPAFYLRWLAAITLTSLLLIRAAAGPLRRLAPYVDLAFMGGAFLLLETKSIVQFALLFGATWFVNSLVFAGVLLSVLAAIEVARRARLPRPSVLYAALATALAVAWTVPQESLLALPPVARFLIATAIAFAPIFLANLIFNQRFRNAASSTAAFGANLLGAMIGGALEYMALVSGYRFLLVVVAALYGLALLTGRSALVRRTA